MTRLAAPLATITACVVLAGCSGGVPASSADPGRTPSPTTSRTPAVPPSTPRTASVMSKAAKPSPTSTLLPGMPPPLDPHDVWAADRAGALAAAVRGMPERVYVPNSGSNTVTVIDPRTYQVIRTVPVGREPQHVVPSWDLKTLWVNNDLGNTLTPINPKTGQFGTPVPVTDPYNLYFTPNGRYALVMAEAQREIDFRDPHTMALRHTLKVPCLGVNHADFSADGGYLIASCEFSGQLLKIDTVRQRVVGELPLPGARPAKPQDVKLSPDGKVFYVADMVSNGVWEIDGAAFRVVGFIPTGKGAHGLYVTRDSKHLLITNRDEGSISVLDLASRRLVAKWHLPGGGSPDMGGLSPDGKVFWVSGRYDSVVYAVSTVDGHLIAKIPVGNGPHGVCIYPQPGRYSLGHTGIFR